MSHPAVRLLLALALAAVFAVAAVPKIADPAAFLAAIESYRLLPPPLAVFATLWVPWLELAVAAAVFPRALRPAALALMGALTIAFLVFLAQAWWRGLDISCGCFGGGEIVHDRLYLGYFARDFGFLALVTAALVLERRAKPAAA